MKWNCGFNLCNLQKDYSINVALQGHYEAI